MTENAIAKKIVDAAFRIHTTLGPGLLESVYDTVLAYELDRRCLRTVREQPIPVVYENVRIDTGFRADGAARPSLGPFYPEQGYPATGKTEFGPSAAPPLRYQNPIRSAYPSMPRPPQTRAAHFKRLYRK